ncbi:MAG: DUF2817 domain-containing protein [Pseudobdellovibrionaceae bacterium]
MRIGSSSDSNSSSILHLPQWSVTSFGTPLELYKSHHKFSQPPLLFIGGVHGDEPEGVYLAEDMILWLKSLSESARTKFQPWMLIPCLNPDGYKKYERTNGNGVDLNRNFPSRDWSSEHEKPRYFPGTQPNSEKETQSLVKLIEAEKPRLIIHFHSWEPCVVYTGDPGAKAAQLLGQSSGYEARPTIGYPTPGSLGQYGWLENRIPVICIEEIERPKRETIWPRFKIGLEKILLGEDRR